MRKVGFLVSGIFLVMALGVTSAPAAGGKDVLERLPSGVINWTQGIVTAKGSGAPPTGITVISQARLMAERAAKADALRNLLEAVKGVRVDSETTVESFTTKNDVVMTRVSGIVKGATIVDKRYLSDGGVEVTVAVYLTGELLKVMLEELPPLTKPLMPAPTIPAGEKPLPPPPPTPPLPKKKVTPPPAVEEKKVIPPPAVEKKKPPATPEVQAKIEEKLDLKKLEYTGLIVDARQLGLRPALIPKILNQKGELVYSSHSVGQQELIRMGLVGYAKDVDAASKNQRVTAEPCIVSGLNAAGEKKTDVVISNRDAQIVLTTAPYTGYLKNGRVMIVYD
ncbi:MAG: LPP20 family lipoprotein [Proteobacteria bacterium]|nr:LPP20 family lipoprotein [Pseudomonadota bacterium]